MKIAILGNSAASVIGFRSDLIKALSTKRKKVYVFAPDYDDFSRKKVINLGAVPIDFDFNRTSANPFADIFNTYKLAKILIQISPDLVFSYFAKPVIFGTFAAVLAGVNRRVGMLEGLGYVFTDQPDGFRIKTHILKMVQVCLYHLSIPFLERLIFLNSDDQADLIESYGIKVKKVSILGGIGVNLLDYPYTVPNHDHVSFLFVGRLLAEKGVNEYISSARLVKEKYPKVKFVMLGGVDENPGGLSVKKIKQLMNNGLVIHPGNVSNVIDWINESSVFVLPSYREGLPRSTQEAMAVGRAVITTDVPGCRETVEDGVNGFLVPRWSPDKIAEKMIYFIENPGIIEQMGLESRRIAQEKFDSSKVNEKLISYLI